MTTVKSSFNITSSIVFTNNSAGDSGGVMCAIYYNITSSAFTNNNAAFGGVISTYDLSLLSPAVILLTTVQVTMVVSWTHLIHH